MSVIELTDETFQNLIESSTKPILIDVWAPWCGPCKMVGAAIKNLAEKESDRLQMTMANMEVFEKMALEYEIKATPTLILFHNGEELARRSGAMMERQISQWLDQNLLY